MSRSTIDEVSPEELARRLDDDAVDVIDIRDPESFEAGHVPGAVNLRPPEIEVAAKEREWADEVVVACYYGKSSVRVAQFLDAATDADAASMAGGFEAWEGPVESGGEVDTSSDR